MAAPLLRTENMIKSIRCSGRTGTSGSHSIMDRTMASGAVDSGSIPLGSMKGDKPR